MRSSSSNYIFIFFAVILFLTTCKKNDLVLSSADDFTAYGIVGHKPLVTFSPVKHTIRLRLEDTVSNTDALVAEFGLSPGAKAMIDGVAQTSGTTKNNFQWDLNYQVTAADQHTQQNWAITASNNDYSYDWGLGHILRKAGNSDHDYSWYIDQGGTDPFSTLNCGPTSVTMAIKWADSGFTKTPMDARQKYESAGGWWFTYDIDNYLSDNSIPHAIVPLPAGAEQSRDLWARQIDSGRVIILCIDMNYIRSNTVPAYHTDKFYATNPGWGHFFVIKGYQQVDNAFYMEVYDPYSLGSTNEDGSLKGKNRFYTYKDVYDAASNWWNYAFVVAAKGKYIDMYTAQQAVRATDIKHAHSN